MADNLACIGFSDPDAFSSHFDRIVETLPPPDGRRRTALWRDPSGASLYVHRDRAGSQVECLTPFFAAEKPTLWRVKSSGGLVDTECVHCSGVVVRPVLMAGRIPA